MAKDDVIDLTDLIQQGSSSQSRGPAPTPPGHVVVPDEKLQMPGLDGVDDLLASLNMTSTPATTEVPPPPEQNAGPSMDLDTILGFKEPPAAPAAKPAADDDVVDISSLLGESGDSAAAPAAGKGFDAVLSEASAAAPAPANDDLDLDALLNEKAAAAPAAAAPADDLDLDALLNEPAAAPAAKPAAAPLDPIAAEALSVVDEAQQELFSPAAAAAAVAAPVAAPVAAQAAPAPKAEPAAVAPAAAPADPALAARVAQCEQALESMSGRVAAVEAAAAAPAEPAVDPALGKRLAQCEQVVKSLLGRVAAVEAAPASTPAEPVADPALAERLAACESAVSAVSGRVDAVEAAAAAPAADDTAPLRDELSECGRSLSALAERVATLEEGARGASDAVLKESLEAACQASETTLRSALDSARQERNDLFAALPGLVAEAVRQVVGQAAAPAAAALPDGLREELDRLGMQCRSMAARLDALEKRLDDMQPAFNANIEKAAAAAMSRLLNEQIAKLTQE